MDAAPQPPMLNTLVSGFLASPSGAFALQQLLDRGLAPMQAGEAIAATTMSAATTRFPAPEGGGLGPALREKLDLLARPGLRQGLPAAEHLTALVTARTGLDVSRARVAVAVALPLVLAWLRQPSPSSLTHLKLESP